MSSIFDHNLSATFRDRAYASFGRGGSFKVAAAFAVGVALTALVLKPIPDEARAAWAGGSSGIDVKAVQADVSARVAAHKQRKAVEVALTAKAPASVESADASPTPVSAPAQAVVTQESTTTTQTAAVQTSDAEQVVPMPAPRPSATEIARVQTAHRVAAAKSKRIARAREEKREMQAENYPSPQAYRISDGRMVRVNRPDPRLPPPNRYASRTTNPLSGLLGLFGVAD